MPTKGSTDIDHQLTIEKYNACGFQGDVSLCSRCWFCQQLVLPTSLNACERNQIVQVCERFISMMHLGELIWKVFFQSERCFNIRPQLSSVPETL